MNDDTWSYDGDYLVDTCRQCGDTVRIDPYEPLPDGPCVCDPCIRRTVNRAASTDLSRHLLETAVLMGRMGR